MGAGSPSFSEHCAHPAPGLFTPQELTMAIFYKIKNDIAKLADVLGHSNIDTTRIYIKSTGKEHKRQLDRMNMIIEKG